jgi:hypothetical protein
MIFPETATRTGVYPNLPKFAIPGPGNIQGIQPISNGSTFPIPYKLHELYC